MANDPTAFNAIVAQIQNNQIAMVNLNNAGITDADCIPLANALKNSTSVTSLNLQYNSIGVSGASSLASALQVNTALISLNLLQNAIGESGVKSLATALRVNTELTTIEIELGNSSDSAIALLQSLTHNYILTGYSLSYSSGSSTYMDPIINQISNLIYRNRQCSGTRQPELQCPLLRLNSFFVRKDERLILTPAHLQITNVSYVPLNGNFSISNMTHCEFLNAQSQSVTTFSQTDINNGTISLQDDGSGIAPSFNVTASYNDLETWPIPAVVNFTGVPLTSSTTTSSSSTSTVSTTSFTTTRLTSTSTTTPTSTPFTMSSTSTASTTPFTTTRLTSTSTTTPTSTPFTMSSTSTASTTPFTSTSRPATTSVAANSAASSSSNLGAIIGGAAAGIATLGAAVFALQRYRRKSSLQITALPTTADAMVANPLYNLAGGAPQHPIVEYDYVDAGTLPRPPQRRAWDPALYRTDEPVRERTSTQWEPRRYEVARHLTLPVNQESQYDTVDDELA